MHRVRTRARRIRSVLAAFDTCTPEAPGVSADLRRLGRTVGRLRDLDVIRERLHHLGLVPDLLDHERTALLDDVRAALDRPRTGRLLGDLSALVAAEAWAGLPPEPIAEVAPRVLRAERERVLRRDRIAADPQENRPLRLHDVRKAAKRLRYAAEAAGPAYEPSAPARRRCRTCSAGRTTPSRPPPGWTAPPAHTPTSPHRSPPRPPGSGPPVTSTPRRTTRPSRPCATRSCRPTCDPSATPADRALVTIGHHGVDFEPDRPVTRPDHQAQGAPMQLELSPEDAAFREEMRTFFTTKVPQEIRDTVATARRADQGRRSSTSQRILNAAGLAVPHWPVEWGGQDWSPLRRHIWHEEMQRACVPIPLAFNASMVGPVIAAFGSQEQKERFLAADRQPRHLVVAGLLRAGRRLRPRVAAHAPRCATATSSSSTARRPGPRSASTATGSSAWSAPTRRRRSRRHLVPAHRHDHPRRRRSARSS